MSARALFDELKALDIRVEVLCNGNLYVAPKSKLNPKLIERVRAAKTQLICMLAAGQLQRDPSPRAGDAADEALSILQRLKAYTLPAGCQLRAQSWSGCTH
jgi:hypothetical protein